MKVQHLKITSVQVRRHEKELLARSLIGIPKQETSRQKYLDLNGWKPCLSLFLATNYALLSISIACEDAKRPDQENLQRLFLESSRAQQINPLSDITNTPKHRVIKTNIPAQYLKVTEKGIYIDDQLKSLERDLYIEAAGDLYLQRLSALGNLTVSTIGKLHLLENVFVDGSVMLRAGAIEIIKRLKGKNSIQLFAENHLNIRGYVKSKNILQMVGIGGVDISGLADGQQGVVLLSAGKVSQAGTVKSKKELASQSNEFVLAGTVTSHEGVKIKTKETLEAKSGSCIGSKSLSLISNTKRILLSGDIFVDGRSFISTPDDLQIDGHFKTMDNVAIQVKNLSLPGYLEAIDGASLQIDGEWKLSGACSALGKGVQGKIGKLILEGLLQTCGTSLNIDKGNNQGALLTRGHCNLTGKTFTHHKGSVVFTTGVHQVDFTGDYQDASMLYTPTLFIGKANHLMFLRGFEASLKDALLSSPQQITVYEGANFKLLGPRTFLQLISDGSANFGGMAEQNSMAAFPFDSYLQAFTLKMAQFKLFGGESNIPTVSDLKKEVEAMALTHAWRTLKKGLGVSMVVGSNVKYSGVSKLDGGPINLNASHSIHSQYGSMQSGSFTDHGIGLQSSSALLDNMTVKSYLDKVTVITRECLKIKDTELSGGLQSIVSSLESEIQGSLIKSSAGEVAILGTGRLRVNDSEIDSQKDLSLRGGYIGVTGSEVKSKGQAFLEADTQLDVHSSQLTTKGNHLSGQDISVKQVKMSGDSTADARRDLVIEDIKAASHLSTRSGNKTSFNSLNELNGVNSQAKQIEINGKLHDSGSTQLIAERLDQKGEIASDSVFIQADDFAGKETSKTKALMTLVLINEKGTGFAGTLEGDTVVIKMDDLQLKALKQVIANVTQLQINKDIVVDEDLLLNNTLHLWANSLIQKGKVTVMGDLIAQLKKEVELYGILDVKGNGALMAGGNFKADRAQISAENLYLQSKTQDVTLHRAALKALKNIKISADEGNIKKTSSLVQAGSDVGLNAGRNIESRSEVERVGSGSNFHSKKVLDKIEAGGYISEEAGGHILFSSVENKAKGGISYKAGGHIIDQTVALETQYSQGNNKNFDKGTRITQSPSSHQTDGDFVSSAEGNQELYAPEISASSIKIEGKKQVNVHDAHDTVQKQSQSESDGGFFGQDRKKQESSLSARSKGAKFFGIKRLDIIGGEGVNLTNIKSTAPQTSLTSIAGAVRLLLGKNQEAFSSIEKSSNILWNKQTSHVKEDKTYSASAFAGSLEITNKEVFVESVKEKSLDFMKQLEDKGINVISTYLDEFHKDELKTVQAPSAALAVVVVVAVTICTAGTGAAIGGAVAGSMAATGTMATVITGMTAAAFTSLCSQAALALLCNEGNIIKAAESLASTKTLENMGIAALSAGITSGVSDVLNIPQSSTQATTLQNIERQAIQSTVGFTTNLISGQKPEEALLQVGRNAAAGIVSGMASRSIGDAYKNHDVDFIGHKFLHALVGGATGALLSDDPLRGAASGALGAVTAEMIGELVLMNSHKIATDVINNLHEKDIPLSLENVQAAVRDELKFKTDFVKLLTNGIALLTGQDVSIANFTASSAVDNNLSHMALQLTEMEVFHILESSSLSPLSDAERFRSLQASTLYNRDLNVCNPRNYLIDEYETLLLYSPDSYTGNVYPKVLLPSATLSNYSAAAECTSHDPINNRVRWGLQTQLLQYGIQFGYDELQLRAANSTEFSYQIHESVFQFANDVPTIKHFPWWVLTNIDMPEYGRIAGEWVYKPTSIFAGLGAGLSELASTQNFDRANRAFDMAYDLGMSKKDDLGCRLINLSIETTNSPQGIDALPWYGKYFLRPMLDGFSFATKPFYK